MLTEASLVAGPLLHILEVGGREVLQAAGLGVGVVVVVVGVAVPVRGPAVSKEHLNTRFEHYFWNNPR